MRTNRKEFSRADREAMWTRAAGKCEACGAAFAGRTVEYDHIIPLALYGEPDIKNGACLCPPCHRTKTATEDVPRIAKAKRIESRRANFRPKRPWPKRPLSLREAL